MAVELNNAAKHAVENRGEHWRVHLILDWVDPETVSELPPPVRLQPGQHVRQVRGRVEIVGTEEEKCVPSSLAAKSSLQLLAVTPSLRMRRATPEQAKQAREAYAKHQQLVGELAEKLGGAEAREALVVGRNAVVRKWYIQHLDARQFWEAVLAVLGALHLLGDLMDGWTDGRTDGRMDGRTDGCGWMGLAGWLLVGWMHAA